MAARKDLKSENFTGNLRRGDSCYTMAESLAILSPIVMRKIENTPDELDDLTKIWLFLLGYFTYLPLLTHQIQLACHEYRGLVWCSEATEVTTNYILTKGRSVNLVPG